MTQPPLFAAAFGVSAGAAVPALYLPVSDNRIAACVGADSFATDPATAPLPIALGRLPLLFSEARESRSGGRFDAAADRYREALGILSSSFHHLRRGAELYREALFGSTVLSGPQWAPETLHHLMRYTARPSAAHDKPVKRTQVNLLRAFTLLGHVRHGRQPSLDLLRRADFLVEQAASCLKKEEDSDEKENACFFSHILRTEILSLQLLLAHGRRDLKERASLREKIGVALSALHNDASLPEKTETVARCYADVALLLARLGLWGAALEKARTVTTEPFVGTAAAKKILAEPIFEPFIDGSRFLSPGEIRLRFGEGQWKKRLQAALVFAQTNSFAESLRVGAAGLVAGVAADWALQGGYGVFAGAVGAALFLTGRNLLNGWITDEARYAGEIGTFDRSWGKTAGDISRLLVRGGLGALTWSAPAAFLDAGGVAVAVFGDTLERAFHMYFRFGRWVVSGATLSVSDLADRLSVIDLQTALYNLYTKSAGVLFAANLLVPAWRQSTDRWAIYFLPGALMLSADLGQVVSGQSPVDFIPHFGDARYWDRIQRVSIVAGEILVMMMTTGVLAMDKRTPRAVLSLFHPKRVNYMIPTAAIITNGLTSAIGGMMQKAAMPGSVALTALQGAAITVGLLPITLGLSGVLKGNIPIGAGVREAWADARGAPWARRLAAAAAGGAAAFHMPYAHNRIVRSVSWDLPAAGLRTLLGWDTNPGQIAMSGTNFIAGNGVATSTWPETGGTRWERDSLLRNTERKSRSGALDDFLRKVGQTMHPMHPFLDHASMCDRLWPLHAVTRAVAPPRFPQRPNVHFYANLDQMLHGGTVESLTSEHLAALLQYVANHAADEDAFDRLRPLVMVLAAARDSAGFGETIRRFFDAHLGLFDLFDLEPDFDIPRGRSRRHRRRLVREAIAEGFLRFERRVKEHKRVAGMMSHMEGLFQT